MDARAQVNSTYKSQRRPHVGGGNQKIRYTDFGIQRAQQGVPFEHVFWAVCIAREYLWEYMQQERLLEEPIEFWWSDVVAFAQPVL